jgi:hypothetical protein
MLHEDFNHAPNRKAFSEKKKKKHNSVSFFYSEYFKSTKFYHILGKPAESLLFNKRKHVNSRMKVHANIPAWWTSVGDCKIKPLFTVVRAIGASRTLQKASLSTVWKSNPMDCHHQCSQT